MIFATNKTVPLTKDIGCSSTFLLSLGISTSRTDLDTVLSAIDSALATEAEQRRSDVATLRFRVDEHLASITAHTASSIVNEPNGNLAATNVQSALNELQSDIDTRARSIELQAEADDRAAQGSLLQSQIDGERNPLRMSVTGTHVVSVAGARGERKSASGAGSSLIVPNGSVVASFAGAELNFASGEITYTSGLVETFSLINFEDYEGMFAKYALVLLPDERLMVIPATGFGTTAANAPEPAFGGGIPIGLVTVQDNGFGSLGTIHPLSGTSIAQAMAVGADNIGNSKSPVDPNEEDTFRFYTRSDFSLERQRFIASTTGSNQILGLKKLVLNRLESFTSTDLTGSLLHSDATPIDRAQVRLVYAPENTDLVPLVEVSRDGGASWTHPPFSGLTMLDSQSVGGTIRGLYGTAQTGGQEAFAQSLVFTKPAKLSSIQINSLYRTAQAPSGSLTFRIVREQANGLPSADIVVQSENILASGLSTASNSSLSVSLPSNTVVMPGKYFLIIEGDAAYKTSTTALVNARFEVNASDTTDKFSFTLSGGSWVQSPTSVLAYSLFGEYILHTLAEGNTVVCDAAFGGITTLTSGTPNQITIPTSQTMVAGLFNLNYRLLLSSTKVFMRTLSTGGIVMADLYECVGGIPSVKIATSSTSYAAATLSSYGFRVFGFPPLALHSGRTYALVVYGKGTNAVIDVARVSSAAEFNLSSAVSSGSGWQAQSNGLYYSLIGTGADLRIRVTSGTQNSALLGFGVNYCHSVINPFPTEAQIADGLLDVQVRTGNLEAASSEVIGRVDYLDERANNSDARIGVLEAKALAVNNLIVGSSAQKAAGTAHYDSIADAINAVADRGKITILPGSYSLPLTVNKNIFFEGLGYGTTITGAVTVTVAGVMFKYVRFAGDVTLAASSSAVNITDCWVASGKTITNNGTNNLILAIGE